MEKPTNELPDDERWLEIQEAAVFLQVTTWQLRRWCNAGILEHRRILDDEGLPNGRRQFKLSDLEAFERRMRVEARV